ncbi:MAG: hypothetical protein AAGB24_15475 [Bacteroidota bacterium]
MISLKTFEKRKITLNLNENRLVLEPQESFDKTIKGKHLVESRFANGSNGSELNIFIGISRNDKIWWFLFDTGNIAAAKISESTALERGMPKVKPELREKEKLEFMLNGEQISTPTIIDNIIYDGALSFDFIRQSEYTISFEDKAVWMGLINSKN